MVMSLRHYAEFLPPAGPPPQPPASANLALASLGASATATSVYSGNTPVYGPQNAIDDDPATHFIGNPADTTYTVTVDLGAAKLISQYRLPWEVGTEPARYVIESSANGTSGWIVRHDTTSLSPALTDLTTPATAQYWRFRTVTQGDTLYSRAGSFQLWGVEAAPDLSQALVLPLLTDSDTLRPPTVTQGPAPTVLVLPKISDGDTLLPPIVTQGPAPQSLVLPKLSDSDTLYPPTVTVGPGPQSIVLPKLSDPDTLLPPSIVPGASQLTLPLLSDPDILLPPTVIPGVTTLTLPLLLSPTTLRPPAVHLGLFPVNAEVEDRVYDSAGPSRVRYVWGQTLEVRLTFTDITGYAADPSAVVLEYQMPDGTEVSYTYGTDTELGRLDTGIYRIQLTPDQSGRWFYRGEGITLGIHSAAEGSFIIRPSEFDPDHTPPVETP